GRLTCSPGRAASQAQFARGSGVYSRETRIASDPKGATMSVARFVPLALISIVLFPGRPAHPQSITGSVSGAVLDPARLPVVGAEVSLRHSATGVVRRTATDEAGRFFFGSLQPGGYALAISAPGFKRLERAAVPVAAAEALALGDLTLSVGALSESV